jgi:hypothetical protein
MTERGGSRYAPAALLDRQNLVGREHAVKHPVEKLESVGVAVRRQHPPLFERGVGIRTLDSAQRRVGLCDHIGQRPSQLRVHEHCQDAAPFFGHILSVGVGLDTPRNARHSTGEGAR